MAIYKGDKDKGEMNHDVLKKQHSWLYKEFLRSMKDDHELIKNTARAEKLEIKITINGTEVPAAFYEDLIQKTADYINEEAAKLVNEREEQKEYIDTLVSDLNGVINNLKVKKKQPPISLQPFNQNNPPSDENSLYLIEADGHIYPLVSRLNLNANIFITPVGYIPFKDIKTCVIIKTLNF